MSSTRSLLFACVGVLALAACASTPKTPPASLTAARAAIENPTFATDATRYAPMEMRAAREKLDLAEAAWRDGDWDQAARFADEALVTERLAETRIAAARAEDARSDVARTVVPGGLPEPLSGSSTTTTTTHTTTVAPPYVTTTRP
jgi:hypothetical protein